MPVNFKYHSWLLFTITFHLALNPAFLIFKCNMYIIMYNCGSFMVSCIFVWVLDAFYIYIGYALVGFFLSLVFKLTSLFPLCLFFLCLFSLTVLLFNVCSQSFLCLHFVLCRCIAEYLFIYLFLSIQANSIIRFTGIWFITRMCF